MNLDLNVIISLLTLAVGLLGGGCVIAYRIQHTLKVILDALQDGHLTNEELYIILADLLSYRKLLRI